MGFEHDNKRMNVQVDRLSSLPDDLIHKILSFIDIKDAIETSSLSSRWRFIWMSMPYLKFSTEDFDKLPKFSKFVTHVLSNCNNEIDVTSLELTFHGKATQMFVKKILNYAFSHNVQELTVRCLYVRKDIEIPLSLLSSQSLKHLTLTGSKNRIFITLTSTLALPALTTLYLNSITIHDDNIDLFSNCPNLKNLTLDSCRWRGTNGFIIRHSRLSNLTLNFLLCKKVNVVAPQLKHLKFRMFPSLQFSADSVRSLQEVEICCLFEDNAQLLVGLLQQMHSVEFLTLNLEFVEMLSSNVELISHQPSLFANLKRLYIYPERLFKSEEVMIPTEVKNYFLDGSPSATLTMLSREEIIKMNNATSAKNLMTELEELLEQEKANIESEMACMHEQRNTQPEPKMQPKIGVSIAQINDCWEDLSFQIANSKEKARDIISKLQSIEEILTELPPLNMAMFQPRFSRLCAEADIVIKRITDCMKIQWDENQNRSSVCFHEIATALQPSS